MDLCALCGVAICRRKVVLWRRPLLLRWIRCSIAVRIPPNVGDHIDVRVSAPVARVGGANFKHSGWPAGSIDQVMPVGFITPERRAVPGAQCLFTGLSDQRQLSIEHPDELILAAVPVALTGPGSRLNDCQVNAELSQPGITRQPLTGLSHARLFEGVWIGAAGLRWHDSKVDLLHNDGHQSLRPTVLAGSTRGLATLVDAAFWYRVADTRK